MMNLHFKPRVMMTFDALRNLVDLLDNSEDFDDWWFAMNLYRSIGDPREKEWIIKMVADRTRDKMLFALKVETKLVQARLDKK